MKDINSYAPFAEPQSPSLSHVMIYEQLLLAENSLLLLSILATHIAAQTIHPLSDLGPFLVMALALTSQVSAVFLTLTLTDYSLGLVTSFDLIDR